MNRFLFAFMLTCALLVLPIIGRTQLRQAVLGVNGATCPT